MLNEGKTPLTSAVGCRSPSRRQGRWRNQFGGMTRRRQMAQGLGAGERTLNRLLADGELEKSALNLFGGNF